MKEEKIAGCPDGEDCYDLYYYDKKISQFSLEQDVFTSWTYDRIEERVVIEPEVLRKVCDEIRAKNPFLKLPDYQIGECIGGTRNTISNALSGSSMPLPIFKNLEKLYGREISHEITSPSGDLITLEVNDKNAEFIVIMLCDGHFNDTHYTIVISLNGVDDWSYVEYVEKMMNEILKKEPDIRWARDKKNANGNEKGVKLRLYSIVGVNALTSAGLIPGNKVKNQVSIPQQFKKFPKSCLKAMTDTDGTIYVSKNDKSFRIAFVNASKPLVEDFKELCAQLDIHTSKINKYFNKRDKTYGYSISIGSKVEVNKFLQKVNPKKWDDKYRRIYWGITLAYLNAPNYMRNTIQKQIEEDFPDLVDRRFSIEFLKYLYNLCVDSGLEINESTISNAITNAFKYERNRYSKDLAEDLRVQFIKLGNLKKLKGQDIPID